MSKESSDHIEDRIREAAENNTPAFSEESWTAMNKLLDNEFGRNPRRRIILFGLSSLAGLMIAIALYFSVTDNTNSSNNKNISENTIQHLSDVIQAAGIDKKHSTKTDPQRSFSLQVKYRNRNNVKKENDILFTPVITTEKSIEETGEENKEDAIQKKESPQKNDISLNTLKDTLPASAITTDSVPESTSKNNPLRRKKSPSSHSLYITGYGGADNNATSILNNGIITGIAGIGIGYHFNNRISLQAGFYAGKKKYRAGAGDYHVKQGSYLSTVTITKIDADCYIFEIPFSVRYDLLRGGKHILYGMVSLSSYIMKKEYYDYYYIKNGMPDTIGWDYKDNRHLFSVAGISLGYEQRISDRFSLLVEPYIKAPLSGIGEGKVKLYSAGLLLGAKYTLFR